MQTSVTCVRHAKSLRKLMRNLSGGAFVGMLVLAEAKVLSAGPRTLDEEKGKTDRQSGFPENGRAIFFLFCCFFFRRLSLFRRSLASTAMEQLCTGRFERNFDGKMAPNCHM